jgi:ATP-binding cassette, subfamily F, member 3
MGHCIRGEASAHCGDDRIVIVVDDVTLKRGGEALFEHLNLTIHPGQRVGMVGRNGVGKSSLFALLRGRLVAEHGEVRIPPRWRIAHLAQETEPNERGALDWAVDGDAELRRVERAIAVAEKNGDDAALASLHSQFDDLHGYSAAARAAEILNGLGFAATDHVRPYREFSGGWRIRLNLAQTLMCPSDLLLLDEPTNHLDLDAMLWLEAHLSRYPGTLVMIAHDREFLDAVTTHTVHLETGRATLYRGNYSAFERQRGDNLAREASVARRQALKAEQINRFVERFRAKATKARQVQSRLKALEKLQLAAPGHVDSPYQFNFPNPSRMSRILIQVDAATLGYPGAPILTTGPLQITPGARIGVLGPNGAGKTTLMRTLAGDLAPLNGELLRGQHSTVGYFAQHQLDLLDGQVGALEHIRRREPKAAEQRHRDYLGGWGFAGDMALRPSASLSGGEKARLVLALIAWQQPALLLLDEPTNHLDIEMRHALTVALQNYEGALVIVSHDRDLLSRCVDEFWLVQHGRVEPFADDLALYAERVRQRLNASTASAEGSRRERRQSAAEQRRLSQPLRNTLKRLEQQIDTFSAQLRELEQRLAEPETYDQPAAELQALLARRRTLAHNLETAEADWLIKQEALDALNGEPHSLRKT